MKQLKTNLSPSNRTTEQTYTYNPIRWSNHRTNLHLQLQLDYRLTIRTKLGHFLSPDDIRTHRDIIMMVIEKSFNFNRIEDHEIYQIASSAWN